MGTVAPVLEALKALDAGMRRVLRKGQSSFGRGYPPPAPEADYGGGPDALRYPHYPPTRLTRGVHGICFAFGAPTRRLVLRSEAGLRYEVLLR